MEIKVCTKCSIEKSLDQFYYRKDRGVYRYAPSCKKCQYEYTYKYRRENRERYAEYSRKEYVRNKIARQASTKKYYYSNIEYHKQRVKKYVEENRESVKERRRIYRLNNKAASEAYKNTRKALKLNAFPKWADKTKIYQIYKLRDELTLSTGIQHHVDHILPLKSNLVCGLHVEHNLRVIPAKENLSKHNRFVIE